MGYSRQSRLPRTLAGLLLVGLLGGCAATYTAIAKKDLDVQTKMSDSVFLDPVGPDKRSIFIQVRNTSDKPNFDIEAPVKMAIAARGYRVTEDPEQAHYKLLAQVLQVVFAVLKQHHQRIALVFPCRVFRGVQSFS